MEHLAVAILSYLHSRDLKQFKRISLSYFLYSLSLLYDSYLKCWCCCVLKAQCVATFEQLVSLALPEHVSSAECGAKDRNMQGVGCAQVVVASRCVVVRLVLHMVGLYIHN